MLPLSSGCTRPVKTRLMALIEYTSVERPGSNVAISGTPASGKINICLSGEAFMCTVEGVEEPPQAAMSNPSKHKKAGKTVGITFFLGCICSFSFVLLIWVLQIAYGNYLQQGIELINTHYLSQSSTSNIYSISHHGCFSLIFCFLAMVIELQAPTPFLLPCIIPPLL